MPRIFEWGRWFRRIGLLAVALAMALGLRAQAQVPTTYELVNEAPFNQPSEYPVGQMVPRDRYRPVGEWVGRLILPTEAEVVAARSQSPALLDWVWFEVQVAPEAAQLLLGQSVRLTWADDPIVQAAVQLLTQPVEFTAKTRGSQRRGTLHPERLNGRDRVGPLQSLAGARPDDNVLVRLEQVNLVWAHPGIGGEIPPTPALRAAIARVKERGVGGISKSPFYKGDLGGSPRREQSTPTIRYAPLASQVASQAVIDSDSAEPVLQIGREPIQVGGRFYGLVSVLGPVLAEANCDEGTDCPDDRFQVQHFNADSGQFNGPVEIVRIPQQPLARNGIAQSTPTGLADSPAGKAGWYLYGAPDRQGIFTVQAIAPRSLFQLQPDRTLVNQAEAQRYIRVENWQHPERHKGEVSSVLLDPSAEDEAAAIAHWQLGDRALVVHLFGGIGGEKAEPTSLATVTGHFAYGSAQVVQEPLANELQFAIEYQQVYAHNPHGIISGAIDWSAYMGSLRYGWLGTRPVSDVLIQLPSVTEKYEFGDDVLWPLRQLMSQLSVMMARYRVGDGTGNASVTPASSCVQDSNQALYAAIQSVEQTVTQSPEIQQWLQQHADSPQTQRFQQLVALGRQLEAHLVPLGMVRADWSQNAQTLAGIQSPSQTLAEQLTNRNATLTALLSWRTMLPRRAHDEISYLALEQGGRLWVLRTNQVGGDMPSIQPRAATELFGRLPAIAPLISRLSLVFCQHLIDG